MDSRFDVEYEWVMNDRCTYTCEYCFAPKRAESVYSAEQIVRAFSCLDRSCLVYMTGGEPFLYPDFVEICSRLTKQNFIGLNTNLTTRNVFDFAERIDASRVVNVNAAVHIGERQRHNGLDCFLEKISLLREAGFPVEISYVAWPPFLERMGEDIRTLEAAGASPVSIKVFRGIYANRRYPESYTPAQRELLLARAKHAGGYLASMNRLSGRFCAAGQRFLRVDPQGNATRCVSIDLPRGNIFAGNIVLDTAPTRCTAVRCKCLFHADRYLLPGSTTGTNEVEQV